MLISPELARARGGAHDLSRIVRWSTRLFALEGVICWVVVAVFRHDLVRFAYGDRYVAYADLLLVLGAAAAASRAAGTCWVRSCAFMGASASVFWANAVGAAHRSSSASPRWPRFGAYGAVVAMIVAELVRIAIMTHFLGETRCRGRPARRRRHAGRSPPQLVSCARGSPNDS